jgi:hypothetical protein
MTLWVSDDRRDWENGLRRRGVSPRRLATAATALKALTCDLDVRGAEGRVFFDVPRNGADRGRGTHLGVYWDGPAGLVLGDELAVGVALIRAGLVVLQVQGFRPPRRDAWPGGSARNAVLLALAGLAPELPLLTPDGEQKARAIADEHGGVDEEWARGEGAPTLVRLQRTYGRLPDGWRFGADVEVFPGVRARRLHREDETP